MVATPRPRCLAMISVSWCRKRRRSAARRGSSRPATPAAVAVRCAAAVAAAPPAGWRSRRRPFVSDSLRRGRRCRRRGRRRFRRRASCGVRERSATPARSCDAALPRRHAAEFFTQRPVGLFGGDLRAFDQRAVLRFAPVRFHVAVAIRIEHAEFERVHADRDRAFVHLAFEREIERGDAEAAHGGRRRAIGEHAIDVSVHVRDRVRPGNMGGAFDHGVARQPGIGAAVEISAHRAGDDPAVLA